MRGTVLDACCGIGYGSKMMHDAGAEVMGIDLEPDAIAYAQEHYPGPVYEVADCQDLSGDWEWIVCLEALEHLPKPDDALLNFRTSAEKLIISTPNEKTYPFRAEQYSGDMYPHLRHYTPEELDKILDEAGWNVIGRYSQTGKRSMVERGTAGMFLIYVCR